MHTLPRQPRGANRQRTIRRRVDRRWGDLLLTTVLLSACHHSPRTPVSTETIDRAGDRIEFDHPQLLKLAEARSSPHEISSLLNTGQHISYGDYVWDEAGVPPGKVWILVDLHAQTMSVFRGQHEIGATVLLFGMDHKPTPIGRFTVLSKDKDHWSSSYDAPMPYSLRLTGDGVAIHGSEVRFGSATHGCLGIPIDFARKLFADASVGDEVLVLRDTRASAA